MTGGTILWVLLVAVFVPLQSNQQNNESLPPSTCRGGFDFYFLIDSSSSVEVGDVFQTQILPLVKNVTMLFVSPLWRVSYITFGYEAVLHLPLTSDRNRINHTLEDLKSIPLYPGTFLAEGLNKVQEQFTLSNSTNSQITARASVILIITDGRLNDVQDSITKADEVRRLGGTIFAIGVGRANRVELSKVANSPSSQHVFYASNAAELPQFVDEVLNYTCVEITGVQPDHICIEQAPGVVTLMGRGLNSTVNASAAFCRFKVNSLIIIYDTPTTGAIEYNSVNCRLPPNRFTGSAILEVSLNGVSVVSSNVVLNFSNCTQNGTYNEFTSPSENPTGSTTASESPTGSITPSESPTYPVPHPITPTQQNSPDKEVNFGIIAGVIAGILVIVVITTLFMLWYCWLIIRKVQFVQKVKPPPEPEKEPPAPKKWPTVDASYYGGGGVGGIKQVQVHWGRRGSTEEGSKLTKSKDATELEVIEEEPSSTCKHQEANTKSCCTTIKIKFTRLGHTISSYRPVRAEEGRVVWCPGPAFYVDRIKLQKHTQRYSIMRSMSMDSSRSSTLRRDSDDSNCMTVDSLKSVQSTQSPQKSSQTSTLQKSAPPSRPAPPPQISAPPSQRPVPPPQRPAPPSQRPAPPPQRPAPPPQRPAPPPQRPAPPPQRPAPPSQKTQRRLSAPDMTKPSVPPRPSVTRQLSANK